jgi:integrase
MTAPTMRTVRVDLSDAQIRAQAAHSDVRELRDMRHPSLRFRFSRDRSRGTWHVVLNGKWHKMGRYPGLTTKGALSVLPQVTARLAADPAGSGTAQGFRTIGEVLEWQLDRAQRNRTLSAKRKAAVKSVITCHLLPRVKDLLLAEANKSTLDRVLFWPLQEQYAVSYVRQVYGVLASALRQARRLDLLAMNPMDGVKFTDFVQERILPREPGLRPSDLAGLMDGLVKQHLADPEGTLLALLMLCHGTRIGETRQALWRHVLLEERLWIIPAVKAKSRAEHQLPLTDQVVALLAAHRDRQRARRSETAYLFPGLAGAALSEKQASEVFVRLGRGHWTSHDLRKLARTCWTELGVDHLIGEMLLNHAIRGVMAAYIHTQAQEKKREALEQWHAQLDSHGFGQIHGATESRPHETGAAVEAANDKASSDSPHPKEGRLQSAAEQGDDQ